MPTPEQLASRFVSVLAGGQGSPCIRVAVPETTPLDLGPYRNSAAARETAAAIRRLLAAAIRVGREAEQAAPPV